MAGTLDIDQFVARAKKVRTESDFLQLVEFLQEHEIIGGDRAKLKTELDNAAAQVEDPSGAAEIHADIGAIHIDQAQEPEVVPKQRETDGSSL